MYPLSSRKFVGVVGEIIDSPQDFPNGSPQMARPHGDGGKLTEERRSNGRFPIRVDERRFVGAGLEIFLNKMVADFGEHFQTRVGPESSITRYQQVGKTARVSEPISGDSLTNPPWRQQRWARCSGMSIPVWVPYFARSLNRSRVVARDRHMHVPSWGSSQGSRAPAHDRLPKEPQVPRCPRRGLA